MFFSKNADLFVLALCVQCKRTNEYLTMRSLDSTESDEQARPYIVTNVHPVDRPAARRHRQSSVSVPPKNGNDISRPARSLKSELLMLEIRETVAIFSAPV